MATKSINKDVKICDEIIGRSLANALEKAERISRSDRSSETRGRASRVKKQDIKEFFKEA